MGLFGHSQHTVTRADKISNFSVNTAEYGAPVMEILGTTRISGNVIYYDDFTAHEHAETVETGKGGGGSTNTNITYTYSVAIIIGLCEGPINCIGRVWKNKDLLYYPDDQLQLTLFRGTANQQPWAYVVGKHPNKALAYPNLAYMAGVIDLGSSGSLPSYNFEVKGKLLSTGDGIDVNPLDYIQYVLSKVGQSGVEIKGAANFQSFCANADLLISTPSDATGTEEAQKIVNEIAELCGAYIFASNDTYKIVPLADRPIGNWTPDKTIRYDLTTDDFQPQNGSCVTWSRKDTSEQYNRWTVEFLNRASGYEKESVTYEDVADIAERGVKQAPTINARYIYTKDRAVKIAEAAARRSKVGRNQYTFKLDWAFCRLEPGDLVRITDEASGIINQPVMITRVQEDEKGLLTFTAISWFTANYGAAEYDVHDVDRPFVDFNVPPGNVATPVIFQPPADLTQNGLEVWLAAKGLTSNWGGCTVFVSDDNEHYRKVGQVANNAKIGALAAGLTESGTSLEVAINGTMLSGSLRDAQRGNTLMWIDGECLSYQTATLLQNGHYRLDGLIRGQYNTSAAAHSSGSTLVRCDERLLKVPFFKEDIGKRIWLKFCSYNTFGAMEQSLAEVTAYEYVIQPYYVPPIQNLTARNRYRQLTDGVNRYDIVVAWETPDLQSYMEGRVWYKTSGMQTKDLDMAAVKVSELGFTGDWIFGGNGKNTVTIPQAIVGDTYKIAVTTVDIWGVETSPDAAPQVTIKVALKTETPNTPDGFGIAFGDAAIASWKEVTNSDIAFYEVRKDRMPGVVSANMLARVTDVQATLPLTERTGTLYLYAYSASGKYSAPAELKYNKPAPPKPDPPNLTAKLGGFSLTAGAIPAGCNGMNIYIDGTTLVSVHTVNNTYTHSCNGGVYDVNIAYTDMFGEGQHSEESRVTVKITVDSTMLDAQAVTKEKLSTALQAAIDVVGTNTQSITALATRMTTAEGNIAADGLAITQNTNSISSLATRVTTAEGTLTAHGTEISQNASDISAIAARVTTAEGIITTHGTSITQNANDISVVAARMTTAEGNISTNTTNIGINADGISAIVTNLNDSTLAAQNYTAIQVMQNGIASKVAMGDVTSYFQQDHTGFYIKGSLINIDGDTVINAAASSAIVNAIQANSIDASKLNVSTLSAICATIGVLRTATSGARLEVRSNQILVYDANNTLRVRLGVW